MRWHSTQTSQESRPVIADAGGKKLNGRRERKERKRGGPEKWLQILAYSCGTMHGRLCHRQGIWEEMNESSEFGRRKSDFQHLEGNVRSEVEKGLVDVRVFVDFVKSTFTATRQSRWDGRMTRYLSGTAFS